MDEYDRTYNEALSERLRELDMADASEHDQTYLGAVLLRVAELWEMLRTSLVDFAKRAFEILRPLIDWAKRYGLISSPRRHPHYRRAARGTRQWSKRRQMAFLRNLNRGSPHRALAP